MPVQMPHPEISVSYDVNPQEAAESRKMILEWVLTNKVPVAGMHIALPAIGTVKKVSQGYEYEGKN
jgi:hypothetical protein